VRRTYGSPREKRSDFWLGFGAWLVFNLAAVALIQLVSSWNGYVAFALSGLLLVLNIATPIVLAFTRRFVALGILVAFSSAFALAAVEGIFFTVSDFAGGQVTAFGGPPTGNVAVTYAFLTVGFIAFAVVAFFIIRAIYRVIK